MYRRYLKNHSGLIESQYHIVIVLDKLTDPCYRLS
jgi:hypothetical protein